MSLNGGWEGLQAHVNLFYSEHSYCHLHCLIWISTATRGWSSSADRELCLALAVGADTVWKAGIHRFYRGGSRMTISQEAELCGWRGLEIEDDMG